MLRLFDLFGEGYFPGAVNIGMLPRTSTTGVSGTRVPNLIYRKFDAKDHHIPIADHVADLVTSENGPLGISGLVDEIARIIAPGGIIILYGPDNMERYHDAIAKATGGTITKVIKDGAIESKIVVPSGLMPARLQGLDLGPACSQCGGMMQRTGSCYTCSSCGNNTGCG